MPVTILSRIVSMSKKKRGFTARLCHLWGVFLVLLMFVCVLAKGDWADV